MNEVPAVARNWWLFVVLGVICVATGIAAIVWPHITLLTLGILAGIYLMIAAVMEIIDAISGDAGGRAMSAILGVIALIAGLICIRRPGESLLAIVIVVGVFCRRGRAPDRARVRLRGQPLVGLRGRRHRRDRRHPSSSPGRSSAWSRWPCSSPSRCSSAVSSASSSASSCAGCATWTPRRRSRPRASPSFA